MRVLVTGAAGFVGKNLMVYLGERNDIEVLTFNRGDSLETLPSLVESVDFIFHLAGVNRPKDDAEFMTGNFNLTASLVQAISRSKKKPSVVYTSSVQVERDNPYGASKSLAEKQLLSLYADGETSVHIFRLPNVFGKWAKPNYNSAVATFCHNISHGLPVTVNDPNANVSLVYIDDVIHHFLEILSGRKSDQPYCDVSPVYPVSVGELVELIERFRDSRNSLVTERVGAGFERKLYSTFVSYFSPDDFTYGVPKHGDERGVFVEMLKTIDSGQFSYFTAHPGVTRGGHYHHTKTEKFLVIKGEARFGFKHMVTGEYAEQIISGENPEIVETVPGWTHDVTNIGDGELVAMLWANEIFDRERPDTYACPLKH